MTTKKETSKVTKTAGQKAAQTRKLQEFNMNDKQLQALHLKRSEASRKSAATLRAKRLHDKRSEASKKAQQTMHNGKPEGGNPLNYKTVSRFTKDHIGKYLLLEIEDGKYNDFIPVQIVEVRNGRVEMQNISDDKKYLFNSCNLGSSAKVFDNLIDFWTWTDLNDPYALKEEKQNTKKTKTLVVCLCGSTRFRKEFDEMNRKITLMGHIVLAPGVFEHSGDPITAEEKTQLDELHLRKIEMSDCVVIICPEGYIGKSTSREIKYAERLEKPILYLK